MDDFFRGIMDPLGAVDAIFGGQKVRALGYCFGRQIDVDCIRRDSIERRRQPHDISNAFRNPALRRPDCNKTLFGGYHFLIVASDCLKLEVVNWLIELRP